MVSIKGVKSRAITSVSSCIISLMETPDLGSSNVKNYFWEIAELISSVKRWARGVEVEEAQRSLGKWSET